MATKLIYGVFSRRADGQFIDISPRSKVVWALNINRDREIIMRSKPLPNQLPGLLVVKSPDSPGEDSLHGALYRVGGIHYTESPIIVCWGYEHPLGVLPVSCWDAQESSTLKNNKEHLLAEATGFCWQIEHVTGGIGRATVEVLLKAYRG